MTDLDQLDIMRRAITALGLGQCAPEDLVAEARASASRREQNRAALSDAQARIKELESALRDLGVNPGGDLQGEVRAISNRAAGDSAAAQHDLDCALRERDRAIDDARTTAARITELEGKIASNVAEAAAREMRIAELERDLADKGKTLKTAHAALTRICEVIGAPVPVCPADAVEAVKTLHAAAESAQSRASQFEGDLLSIGFALNDAGAPTVYDMPDDSERPIPDLERIRILGGRLRTERGDREQAALRAQRHADYLRDAHVELDYCGAPKLADGVAITPAARIRAYVEMVTAPTEDPSIALRQWTRDVWGEDDSP